MSEQKVELLAPAGSMESAKAAIQNGCDAIYLAGKQFGARAFAANFDDAQLKEVIRYAHAYGVKVYVTLNTLIHDEELAACKTYIRSLYAYHTDALIVQDLGILYYVRSTFPDFEVHASTQMHIINEEALRFLYEQGVTRAVLAREVKLEEIRRFAKLPIELEVFVHGALCVAYSGQCLMSHMIGGRSGNRGECAQSCRMPYSLVRYDTKEQLYPKAYLLSLKDLNTLQHLTELVEAGITSFKMEGRMKKSEYVGYMTKLYRKKIDDASYIPDEKEQENAKLLFHRGYTTGFLYHKSGSDLYHPLRPNHMGIRVGKVLGMRREGIFIHLEKPLYQGDGVRILKEGEDIGGKVNKLYRDGLLVNGAQAGERVVLAFHGRAPKGSVVLKTSDPRLEEQIEKTYAKPYRKIELQAKVIAHVGKPLMLQVWDDVHRISNISNCLLEKAQKRATTKAEVAKQLHKTKDTIFVFASLQMEMDEEVFIPVKVMNDLRRQTLAEMYERRSEFMVRENRPFTLPTREQEKNEKAIHAKVRTEAQLRVCLEEQIKCIYVEDEELYEKYASYSQVVLSASRIAKQGYEKVGMIADIGGLHACDHPDSDHSLNAYNALTCYYLKQCGVDCITLSVELDKEDVKRLLDEYIQHSGFSLYCQVIVYGRMEVMISEHCPINACLLDNGKASCQLCRKHTLALQDKFGNHYPMYNDRACRMHLYDAKILDRTKDIAYYQSIGVPVLRYDFTWETPEETREILRRR